MLICNQMFIEIMCPQPPLMANLKSSKEQQTMKGIRVGTREKDGGNVQNERYIQEKRLEQSKGGKTKEKLAII